MAVNQGSTLIDPGDLTGKVPLDSGRFGHELYRCHHRTHGQVLLKTVCTGGRPSKSKRKSLLEEAEPLLLLSHGRIVRVLGVVLEDGPPGSSSLLMQFLPIGNLLAILNKVRVPISIKGRIILDILEGMVYLMNNDIVHKDLKPQNILVGEDFHIKIADLGLASCRAWSKLSMEESRRQSRKGACVRAGALFYMAPEHLQNINTPFTEKSDVYSFAIVIWVILTNQEPYRHLPEDQVTSAVCKGGRPDETLIPPSSPENIVTLMKKCWLPCPASRPTFAESYELFRYFYRNQLEKSSDKDLQSLMSQRESLDLVSEMSSLAVSEPHWQPDALSRSSEVSLEARVGGPGLQEGRWLTSLQTDARPLQCGLPPHGSYISSPDLSVPSASSHRHPIQRQASSNPQLVPREDPLPCSANVTVRERKSEGPGRAQTCPNCMQHPPGQRTRSWPVFPEPEAHSGEANANAASMLQRQRSAGVVIYHAFGVQIGDYNNLEITDAHEDGFQASSADFSLYEELLQEYEHQAVRKEQLELLSKNIRKDWKFCARSLGLTNTEVETISYDNHAMGGLSEMVHQMLVKWQEKTGLVGCTIGELCRALRNSQGVSLDLLCELLLMCQGCAAP